MRRIDKPEPFVEISSSELFTWWDWLDSLEDTPEKAFDLFTKFLEECEDTMYCCNDEYLEETHFIRLDNDDKNLDIPFTPRHDF